MISHSAAYVFLVVNMAIWGGSLVVARGTEALIPPMALTFWRWVLALVVLLPFVARKLYRELPLKPEARRSVFVICLYMALGTTLSVVAVNYTTAVNATVINGTQPTMIALVRFILLREHLTLAQAMGIASAFLGVLVIVFQSDLDVLLALSINRGDAVMLGATMLWALYSVEVHRGRNLPSPDLLVFLIACMGVATGLPLYVIEAMYFESFDVSAEGLGAIAYLSLGSTVLAVYLWNAAIRSVGANRAGIFLNLIPVFGIVLAIIFLGERLFGYHAVGAILASLATDSA